LLLCRIGARALTMDLTIFALLTQDGITNGAVYALLALALVSGVCGHARDLDTVG
jgi:hypothetical protein